MNHRLMVLSLLGFLTIGCSQTGHLMIKGAPDGTRVMVDGKEMGATRTGTMSLRDVEAGPHSIRLESAGYHDYESDVTVLANQTRTVDATRMTVKNQTGTTAVPADQGTTGRQRIIQASHTAPPGWISEPGEFRRTHGDKVYVVGGVSDVADLEDGKTDAEKQAQGRLADFLGQNLIHYYNYARSGERAPDGYDKSAKAIEEAIGSLGMQAFPGVMTDAYYYEAWEYVLAGGRKATRYQVNALVALDVNKAVEAMAKALESEAVQDEVVAKHGANARRIITDMRTRLMGDRTTAGQYLSGQKN